ncbi:MAG: tripartite tricarboxylate transporter substrate binding protein [Eubacteriales bacterium]|nr:tripartite tricarboxylate transporter substrate binding protein [Eubacteriales bacterium]
MKKMMVLLMAMVMLFASVPMVQAEEAWKFERKVDLVCPWGVGGGADSTLRPMADLLKDILGVQVEVLNVEGGGGANGVEFTYKQPADGYTFMLGTQSLILMDLQDVFSMDYRTEFVPVAKLVHSVSIIAGSKKAMEQKGYNSFSEMVEYVKANPFQVSVGMLTATGADSLTLLQTIEGLDVMEVPYTSGSEMNSALMGGHIDMMVTGTDEISGLIESGDVVPLVACVEQRMKRYPDLECTGELGIDSFIGTWRGIYAKNGTPQAAIDAMEAAIEKASQDPKWQEFLVQGAYDERVGFEPSEGLKALEEKEYTTFSKYLNEQGLLRKPYDDISLD